MSEKVTTLPNERLTNHSGGCEPPAEVAAVLEKVVACSRDAKRVLLERLLRDLLGDSPEGEYAVCNPDGSVYLHVLSAQARARLFLTPDRLARWQKDIESGAFVPLSETVAKMESGQLG